MTVQPKHKLRVEDYVRQYAGTPAGRYELVDGAVVTMAAETSLHNITKGRLFVEVDRAVSDAGLDCQVFTDGMTVKIDEHTAREPDAAVQCEGKILEGSLILDAPLIVFEVVSPSSERDDIGAKLVEYFSVSSIQHYVVVDPWKRVVVHHRRESGNMIQTVILGVGEVRFDPPGFSLAVEQLLGER
jgi:Uma2 family endonuclease